MKLIKPAAFAFLICLLILGFMPEKAEANTLVFPEDIKIDIICSNAYAQLRGEGSRPDYDAFKEAFTGFINLKAENRIKKYILTIIDFSISSRLERMWIIDIEKMEVIGHSLVAHGKNSGEEFASHFSNTPSSLQSSLGFYISGEIYYGSHGMSLSLDGIEPGINDKARERGIIMHGADYVSSDFIGKYGRLGRSFGCPAIPMKDHEKVIKMLTGKSCIYIYSHDQNYQQDSHMLVSENTHYGLSLLPKELPGISESGSET